MTQGTIDNDRSQALEIAWQRFAELDANAIEAQKWHLNLCRLVIILSVVATLLAISSELARTLLPSWPMIAQVSGRFLILVPIAGSLFLAFVIKFQYGERWLVLRSAAEEIKKQIYSYRTVNRDMTDRHLWLKEQTAAIQRRTLETLGGDLVLSTKPEKVLPPYDENSDPGFDDLSADGYLKYRVKDQLDWHSNKISYWQSQRLLMHSLIFIFGGLGTFLAALGGSYTILVALTTSLAAAFTAWTELRQHDVTVKNYSQVIQELEIIQDHWKSLNPTERTQEQFSKLVTTTEEILWSQHKQFVSTMREALAKLQTEDAESDQESEAASAIAAAESAGQAKKEVTEKIDEAESQEATADTDETAPTEGAELKLQKGAPHAFVVMPFGQKPDSDGKIIDFDAVYRGLIRPALIKAGFEPFRADEESVSGDILTDMFQELLLADLVIADLSIDNANAFYELGVRHALRKRGIVHIQSGRAYMPFDVFNVRTIPYHTGADGKPDPAYRDKDIDIIANVVEATWVSDRERVHSPIFNLLDGLPEPNRKALQTPLATGYWRKYQTWQERIQIAQRQEYIGDVLLLTEEVPNPLFQEEAIAEAGRALRNMGNNALARQQYQRGLAVNPKNKEFQREEAFHLNRLGRSDEAIVKLERLLKESPGDSETISYLGRFYKDMWRKAWSDIEDEQERLTAAYEADYLLKRSIDVYQQGYNLDQNHYYSGINVVSLSTMLDHLFQLNETSDGRDPEVEAIRQQLPTLTGAVQYSIEQAVKKNPTDFWALASLGDLAVCTAESPAAATRAYKKALAVGGKDQFSIHSVISQLEILESLAFRPDFVGVSLDLLRKAIDKLKSEEIESHETEQDPVQIFLFAGHMIDQVDRLEPRFPPAMEDEAREKIEAILDKLEANDNDLAITPGAACGGDILFIEACLKRGMKVETYLPFHEARFIEESVRFAQNSWVERFHQIRQHPNVTFRLQPERVGPVPAGDNVFERNVRWALYSTLVYDIERVRLIVLWDGKGGDGPGGTGHMVREVHQLGGIVQHLDTTKFDYWRKNIKA